MGFGLITLGVVLILAGVVVAMSGSPDEDTMASATSTTAPLPSTTVTSTTISRAATTTTTSLATTTTVRPETVEEFVALFAAALDAGDRDFLMTRLHPAVVDGFSDEVCEAWVGREIMGLSDYRLTEEPSGPIDKNVTVAGQSVTIHDVYTAPVSFTFQGQSFDSSADFSVVDGVVHWLGSCE